MKFGNSVMHKLKAREFHFVRFSDVADLWTEWKKGQLLASSPYNTVY